MNDEWATKLHEHQLSILFGHVFLHIHYDYRYHASSFNNYNCFLANCCFSSRSKFQKKMLGNSYWSHSPFTSKFINKSYTHIISHINFHNAIKSVILLGFFWCQRNWFQSILLPPYSKCRLVLIFNRKPHRNTFICMKWLWLMQYLAMLMWYFMVARVFRTFYCV